MKGSSDTSPRNESLPIFLTVETHSTHTDDCMVRRRKVIVNCDPDTTNCRIQLDVLSAEEHTLFTTVIRIDAMQ